MIVQKVVCENTECRKEIKAEAGAPVVSASIGLGGHPMDFCSVRCCKQYLTAVDVEAECNKIKDKVAEQRVAQEAVAAAGIDPSQVDHLKIMS